MSTSGSAAHILYMLQSDERVYVCTDFYMCMGYKDPPTGSESVLDTLSSRQTALSVPQPGSSHF